MEGITRVINSLKLIRRAQGYIVDDFSLRNPGRRYEAKESKSKMWGGKRSKKTQKEFSRDLMRRTEEVHKDVDVIWMKKMKQSASMSNDYDNNIIYENNYDLEETDTVLEVEAV